MIIKISYTYLTLLSCYLSVLANPKHNIHEIPYSTFKTSTINNKEITTETFKQHFEKAPQKLTQKVKKWLKKHPGAQAALLSKQSNMVDVGYLCLIAKRFFNDYSDTDDAGSMNHVISLPDSNYFMKITSVISRFLYTASELGIDFSFGLMLRTIKNEKKGKTLNYIDLDEDKAVLKEYLLSCFDKEFLAKKPSKWQQEKMIEIISDGMPQGMVRRYVYKLMQDYCISDQDSFENMLHEYVDTAFAYAKQIGYQRKDIENKQVDATYGIASRMFHCHRFAEAISLFKLDKLEIPPTSYAVNINEKNPTSLKDEDLIFLQKKLNNHKSLQTYFESHEEINDILSKKAIMQLCIAAKYAGLWDFSGSNIFVHEKTKKITMIDFEPYRDITKAALFGADKQAMKKNLCVFLSYMLNRLPKDSQQKQWVYEYIEHDRDITLEEVDQADDRDLWKGRSIGLLGKFMRYENPTSNNRKCAYYRDTILREFLTTQEKINIDKIWTYLKNQIRHLIKK